MGVEFSVLESSNGSFPKGIPLDILENLAQADFSKRGMRVIDGFFKPGHEVSPKNLSYLVLGILDEQIPGLGSEFKLKDDRHLVSEAIIEEDSVDGIRFLYANKFDVAPPYHGNGLLIKTVDKSLERAREMDLPLVLRTSDSRVSRKYAERHDIYTVIGDYAVHGFGFQVKASRVEKFNFARKIFSQKISPYVASKLPTVVKVDEGHENRVTLPPQLRADSGSYSRLLSEIEKLRGNKNYQIPVNPNAIPNHKLY